VKDPQRTFPRGIVIGTLILIFITALPTLRTWRRSVLMA
jgi:amino acid transporter